MSSVCSYNLIVQSLNNYTFNETIRRYESIHEQEWNHHRHFCKLFQRFWYHWFYTLIQKMHSVNFSKDFLYWAMNHLTFWQLFVQIDAYFSVLLISEFGVPQGSILGPILFHLCVADMLQMTPESECLQYADDTTLCWACKASQ